MHLSSTTLASILTYSSVILAMPSPSQSANVLLNRRTVTPVSFNCGVAEKGFNGLGAPGTSDLPKAATRLAQKGGICTTPAGNGNCVRVACDNTTGIFMCNSDASPGPNSADCANIAAYAYAGDQASVFNQCNLSGAYGSNAVADMAVDQGGQWTVIAAYGNCNHPSTDQPDAQ